MLTASHCKTDSTVRGVIVIDQHSTLAAGLSCQTRTSVKSDVKNEKINAMKKSENRIISLVNRLYVGLKSNVYDPELKQIISYTKQITNLTELALQLRQPESGHIKLSITEGSKFLNAVRKMPVTTLENVEDAQLLLQYSLFMERLEKITKNMSQADLENTDPKDLIMKFLETKNKLYIGIEMIMQAICVSSVKHSLESILESFISIWECHFDSRRNLNEDSCLEEFSIAVNGPCLSKCDLVLEEAMHSYWRETTVKGIWKFFKTSVSGNLNDNSIVLDRLLTEHSKLRFMEI